MWNCTKFEIYLLHLFLYAVGCFPKAFFFPSVIAFSLVICIFISSHTLLGLRVLIRLHLVWCRYYHPSKWMWTAKNFQSLVLLNNTFHCKCLVSDNGFSVYKSSASWNHKSFYHQSTVDKIIFLVREMRVLLRNLFAKYWHD